MSNYFVVIFALFDKDGDGAITFDEVVRLLSSFYEVLFALSHNAKKQFDGMQFMSVAVSNAEACFKFLNMEINDTKITYEQFALWHFSNE